jgi:hypothetical protein
MTAWKPIDGDTPKDRLILLRGRSWSNLPPDYKDRSQEITTSIGKWDAEYFQSWEHKVSGAWLAYADGLVAEHQSSELMLDPNEWAEIPE